MASLNDGPLNTSHTDDGITTHVSNAMIHQLSASTVHAAAAAVISQKQQKQHACVPQKDPPRLQHAHPRCHPGTWTACHGSYVSSRLQLQRQDWKRGSILLWDPFVT